MRLGRIQHFTRKLVEGFGIILEYFKVEDFFGGAEAVFVHVDHVVDSTLGSKVWDAAGDADSGSAEDDDVFASLEEVDGCLESVLEGLFGGLIGFVVVLKELEGRLG